MKRIWFNLLLLLVLIVILVWLAVFSYFGNNIKLIACDVGQGDAFLITQKNLQILIDGGANQKVLRCLSDNMPFWDRTVDVVVLSHPQKDHFTGLINVFESYEVKYMFTTPLDSVSTEWRVLEDLVGGSDTKVINPTMGEKYRLGLIYLDILYPTDEFLLANLNDYTTAKDDNVLGAYTSGKDPNEFSLVLILSYKSFDALFTGDISPKISDEIAKGLVLSNNRRVEYIKVPHHGSKNGLSKSLLDAIRPKVAAISSGKGNSYGHPHKEVMDMLNAKGIRILRTDDDGEVVIEIDGESMVLKK